MTSRDFVFWLSGYLSVFKDHLPEDALAKMKAILETVILDEGLMSQEKFIANK